MVVLVNGRLQMFCHELMWSAITYSSQLVVLEAPSTPPEKEAAVEAFGSFGRVDMLVWNHLLGRVVFGNVAIELFARRVPKSQQRRRLLFLG